MAKLQDDLLQAHGAEVVEPFVSAAQADLQKGRAEESRALLEAVLVETFGPLPTELAARVAAAPPEQCRAWILRVGKSATLEQVFQG